ncbi:hypothetical protein [Parabacteroides leei]|uniref:hypothetical protein n=2 Tax=Parabacteroides leei TaxID=2939491 RepID=UPI0032424EEE
MATGDIIFEDGTVVTPADLERLLPLIEEKLGSTAKDPSQYPSFERLDGLTSIPCFDASYNLGRVSIALLQGVNGKNIELRMSGDMLQWSLEGTDIWYDLFSKADLKGDPGAAANMEIGEVTSGDAPSATITGEAPNYKLNLVLVPGGKGDTGDNGKTPVLASVSAKSGETASGNFTEDGFDESGNPKYILDLTLPKGQDGQPAIFEQGTTTTLNPSEEARVEVVENGLTPEGNPKYLLNFFIPRGPAGPAGTGTGNVLVDATGLVIGKKYLFVPDADDSTAGTFVEYVAPEIPEQVQPDWDATEGKGAILNKPGNATADSSGLMSADQFQKLEKLNPSYLSNDVTGKKVEYTDAGKLLFEGKEAFAVDADNELTLAGKKLSELGGGAQYLDLSPLLDAEGNPITTTTDEFLAQVETAYVNHAGIAIIEGDAASMSILSDETTYNIIVNFFTISNNLSTVLNNDIQIVVYNFRITKADKSVLTGVSLNQSINTGDGNKFKSNDGTYKEVGGSDFVEIPFAVLELTNSSTSDQIKTTFGGDTAFDNIHSKIKGGKMAYSIFNVEEAGITMAIPFVADGGMADAETKALQLMYINPLLQKPEHVNLIINKSIAGNTYTAMSVTNQLSYDLATTGSKGLMSPEDKTKLNRYGSKTTATTVANLDANYENIEISDLSANASLSVNLTGTAYDTWSIYVAIYCSSARTITIPTSGNYISMIGSSLTCPAGKWTELHLKCLGGKWRIAKLEQE